MNRIAVILALCFLIACGAGATLYAIQKCGVGVLAYKNPVLAAVTGECRAMKGGGL